MGVIKNKFGINSELIFYYDYRGFQWVIVARSTDESYAVRDTVAAGNIEILNGMAPKGTKTIFHKKNGTGFGSIFCYSLRGFQWVTVTRCTAKSRAVWDTFIEDNMDVFNGRAVKRLQTEINREKISVIFVFYTLIVIFALYSGNRVQDIWNN